MFGVLAAFDTIAAYTFWQVGSKAMATPSAQSIRQIRQSHFLDTQKPPHVLPNESESTNSALLKLQDGLLKCKLSAILPGPLLYFI